MIHESMSFKYEPALEPHALLHVRLVVLATEILNRNHR